MKRIIHSVYADAEIAWQTITYLKKMLWIMGSTPYILQLNHFVTL